ncbi:MAG: D-lactate dehydrogenase VanH-B, partial [Oscillospiraceae bacterium]|nr:D-lactate dehydrogenase VanH-B [Oscillospiraceae bacterium]
MNQVNGIRLPVFGCERDEAEMFRALAPRFGVTPELFGGAPSEAAARAVGGARYISVSHKTRLPASVIYPLRDAGVEYISSRSVGLDHIDVAAARRAGIAVGNTEYSPDGVADYAVMLLLMAVRGAKRTVA